METGALIKYINYILFSSHRRGHGIHSPFVFHLISDVFRNKSISSVVIELEKIRKNLTSDKRIINVHDLGAGSKYRKDSLRKISEITRHSSIPRKYGYLLFSLSGEFGGQDILELGTSLGISTMYLAKGSPSSTVHTIEGCPRLSEIARDNFEKTGCRNIISHTGHFEEVISDLASRKISPGLSFIDGHHKKEPVIKYFTKLAEMGDDKSVIVLDDIHSTREMGEAWEEIKKHPEVSVTVDIFRMGLVFFSKGVMHGDYIVRY